MAWRPEAGALRRAALLLVLALTLAGCGSLPARQPPATQVLPPALPAVDSGSALPGVVDADAGESPQHFVAGTAPPADWWQAFGNPALADLIREAQARHPDIDAARAAVRQAEAELEAARGDSLAPHVGAQAGASTQRVGGGVNGTTGAVEYRLYNASVGVSYSPDLFGGVRAALDGLGAQVDVQRYQLEAVRLTLAGNIVTAVCREAGLRAERSATLALQHELETQLALARSRLAEGAATLAEVINAETALRVTVASLPALDKALAQTRHQLASYVGRGVGGEPLPEFALADLRLPAELPLSLPSEIARQRPDLRAAEAALQAADAAVGVAEARRYPSLTLSASLGQQSTSLAGLFKPAATLWSLGGSLAGTVFDGGALSARARAAQAAYDQVDAQYRATVLQAFQQVVDVMAALALDARTVDAELATVTSTRASADLLERQLALGAASRQQWLVARINALQAEIGLGSARAARLADSAALYQALGGGWSRATEGHADGDRHALGGASATTASAGISHAPDTSASGALPSAQSPTAP